MSAIDNPYWPMAPGSRWVYRETDGKGGVMKVVVTVTDRTKTIDGIAATVVHDVVSEDGKVVEDTFDWYAQDRWGNVWYLGEDTTEYEDGKASTAGSWEAGVDGAQAGVILPGQPEVGQAYRQEYYAGEAEDAGESSASTSRRGCRSAHTRRPDDQGLDAARAEARRAQVLRAGSRAGARPHRVRRVRPRGALSFEPGG